MKQKLTLTPETFLWCKGDDGLLYHAATGSMFRFNAVGPIEELCRQFENIDNLYSVAVEPDSFDEATRRFVGQVEAGGFGKLTDIETPVVSLPPLLNIQRDVERLNRDKDRGIGENVLDYLSTLTIYIGGVCRNKPYFKQIIYPVCSEESLNADNLVRFLNAARSSTLQTINLVVSDVTDPQIVSMSEKLKAYKERIVFYFLYSDLNDENVTPYMMANEGYKVRFICERAGNIISNRIQRKNIAEVQKMLLSFGYNLLVRNDRDCEFWDKMVNECGFADYTLIPLYDDNPEFFEHNVFLDESDLAENRLSRREVFAHQAINTSAFGKLTIMPDGKVYSDVTAPALGTLDDSIYELIMRELENNYAWRRIRNSKECQNCIYQWLCPSPTPYEKAAEKETVCNFR